MSTTTRGCMCGYLRNILWFCTYFGGFPLVPCANPKNHTINGCQFRISKLNIFISVIIQIIVFSYVVWTIWSFLMYPDTIEYFVKYAQAITVVVNELDMYVNLIFSLVNARKTCNILKSLALIPSGLNDMKKLAKYLNRIMVPVLLMTGIQTLSWITSQDALPFYTPRIFDCALGYMFTAILIVIPYAHLFVIIILYSLISSKFEHLADRIERYFKDISEPKVSVTNSDIFMIKPNIASEENVYNIKNTTLKLKEFNHQYRALNSCLKETNSCSGLTVLVSFTVSLYALIYFIFRKLTSTKYNLNIHILLHSILRIVLFSLKIFLFIYTGHTITKKSEAPLLALQEAAILHLPQQTQVQFQTLLLQWKRGPAYLDALSIVHIGPWLVAPVIGNIITYLLVFLQYDQTH